MLFVNRTACVRPAESSEALARDLTGASWTFPEMWRMLRKLLAVMCLLGCTTTDASRPARSPYEALVGKIESVHGKEAVISVGKREGVSVGMTAFVTREGGTYVAEGRVVSVREASSDVEI